MTRAEKEGGAFLSRPEGAKGEGKASNRRIKEVKKNLRRKKRAREIVTDPVKARPS